MSTYPALSALGIQNPQQISRFFVYMSDHTDILRIVYDRKKGSLLPVTRKYEFPQLLKSTLVDSGTRQTQMIYESTAAFRKAVSELEGLMDTKDRKGETAELIVEEIRSLEEDITARFEYIKSLASKLQSQK